MPSEGSDDLVAGDIRIKEEREREGERDVRVEQIAGTQSTKLI
jgi:hypothetical protein